MKEQLYTIPLNEAMDAHDECPFCYVERAVEQDLLDFTLGSGSSYMEADIREQTDLAGFCRPHFKKMFDYGNTLGNAWILKTHYKQMISELKKRTNGFAPGKVSFFDKLKKTSADSDNALVNWVTEKEESCYICKQFKETYARYLDTFFYMYDKDEVFREKVAKSKGFCLPHFKDICLGADERMNDKDLKDFYKILLPLMEQNMERVAEDVAWMVEKFDYKNANEPWRDSKDAIQRGMQKLKGGYPADAPYEMKK